MVEGNLGTVICKSETGGMRAMELGDGSGQGTGRHGVREWG